jgi:multiple sugar transport system permease protein
MVKENNALSYHTGPIVQRKDKKMKRESIAAYLFILPALLTFCLFVGIPIVSSIVLMFQSYDIITPAKFVGLKNINAFFHDRNLLTIYLNTFKFAIVLVPLHVVIGLALAYLVTRVSQKLQYIYRTIIYFPSIVTTASVAIAWGYLYNTNFGAINYFLGKLGINPIPWLSSSKWSIPAIAIFSLWKFVGIAFLYYFIGLQGVPQTLHEAAKIDGANARQIFFRITLPLLTPTLFFVIVTTIIGSIQIFDEPFLITNGGPGNSSRTVSLYIYEQAFQAYKMGYASTIAVSLFLIVLIITIIQFSLSKRWIHYEN